MDADIVLMNNFIERSAELAEFIQWDIQNNGVISNDTVLALAKYYSALEKVAAIIDKVRDESAQLN